MRFVYKRNTPRIYRIILGMVILIVALSVMILVVSDLYKTDKDFLMLSIPFWIMWILLASFAFIDGYSALLSLIGKKPITFIEKFYVYWDKKCNNCNTYNETTAEFCKQCGKKISN